MRTAAAREEYRDPRVAQPELCECVACLRDVPREHLDMRIERRVGFADLIKVSGGDVSRTGGTKSVETDGTGRGRRLERAAKTRVIGGEEAIDAAERAKNPTCIGKVGQIGQVSPLGRVGKECGDLAPVY